MNATNSTIPPDSNSLILLSSQELALLGILTGLTMQICFSGFISTQVRVYLTKTQGFWILAMLMNNFNFWCLMFHSMFMWTLFAIDDASCGIAQHLANISAQCSFLAFDAFLLYKTYEAATPQSKWIVISLTVVLLFHRLGWLIYDVLESYGVWNNPNQSCDYYQNPVSGQGFRVADLIADAISLILVAYFKRAQCKTIAQTLETLMQYNGMRSLLILIMNAASLLVSQSITDLFTSTLVYLITFYVNSRLLNAELFWIESEKRKKSTIAVKSSESSSGKGIGSTKDY